MLLEILFEPTERKKERRKEGRKNKGKGVLHV
jgi:hypothetical protein